MLNLSYTKTPEIREHLDLIETLRTTLLLTPLPPIAEAELKWQILMDRVYYALLFEGKAVSRESIDLLFNLTTKKAPSESDAAIVQYKSALDYLYYNWLASKNAITEEEIKTLAKYTNVRISTQNQQQLVTSLRYLQVSPDHPVIQGALAYALILSLSSRVEDVYQLATMVSLLFLYKDGYDFRQLVNLEQFFFSSKPQFVEEYKKINQGVSPTGWVLYYSQGVISALTLAQKQVEMFTKSDKKSANVWNVTDRQKEILAMLDKPASRISNKMVQKIFHISQITASRDLAKLANLGLILTLGKGRSTYYVKA